MMIKTKINTFLSNGIGKTAKFNDMGFRKFMIFYNFEKRIKRAARLLDTLE